VEKILDTVVRGLPKSSPIPRNSSLLFPKIRHEITVLLPSLLFRETHAPLNIRKKIYVDTFVSLLHILVAVRQVIDCFTGGWHAMKNTYSTVISIQIVDRIIIKNNYYKII
jgi:hypothetical protein